MRYSPAVNTRGRGSSDVGVRLFVLASTLIAAVPLWAQTEHVLDHHALSPQFTSWLTAVAEHGPGAPDAPAERIAAWPESNLRAVLRELDALDRALARAAERRRPFRPRGTLADEELLSTRETLAMLDLGQDAVGSGGSLSSLVRRGVLLHSDLAVLLRDGRMTSPASAGVDERGALIVLDGQHRGFGRRWPHWDMARELLARRLHDADDADVARRWYAAAAANMYAQGALADLVPHLQEAERLFRTDALVSFYGGLLHARIASPPLQHAVRQAALPPGRKSDSSSARTHLERARGFLLRALDADPDMVEARVRLGHVLLELKESRAAADQLQRALGGELDPPIRYCAELFLGDALASLDDPAAARTAFERAAALFPDAQSPWVALSRLARAQGDRALAASVLERVLQPSPGARRFEDPWWTYYLRDTDTPERLLDQWRLTVAARSDAQ